MSVSVNGTNGLTFNDGSTQNTSPFAGGLGFRNRIINGACMIDQRNAGAAKSCPASTVTYTLDRWLVYPVGNAVSVQQVASGLSTGSPNAIQATGASSVTNIILAQRIESKNIVDCVGQTVTVSVTMANSLLTSISWLAEYANTADNFANTTSIASGTITVNSTMTTYSFSFTVPANGANGVSISLTAGAQTSGTWKVTQVQLEKGSTATSFDYRPYGTELALCQRYYEKSFAQGAAPVDNGGYFGATLVVGSSNGSSLGGNVVWKVTKRAAPSVTFYRPDAGTAGTFDNGGSPITAGLNDGGMFAYTTTITYSRASINWAVTAEL